MVCDRPLSDNVFQAIINIPLLRSMNAINTEVQTVMQVASGDSGADGRNSSSGMHEGPVDVEGSAQWFNSLPPSHLPLLAVMPNAEVRWPNDRFLDPGRTLRCFSHTTLKARQQPWNQTEA